MIGYTRIVTFITIVSTLWKSSSQFSVRNNRQRRNANRSGPSSNSIHPKNKSSPPKPTLHDTRVEWAKETDAVILIDAENVRGKSNFVLSHRDLLTQTTEWAEHHGFQHKIVLVVDHGTLPHAYHLPGNVGLTLAFAGKHLKADDVLARDVAFFGKNVLCITADNELMSRCRNSIRRRNAEQNDPDDELGIQFLQPIKYVSDLENMMKWKEKDLADGKDRINDDQTSLAKMNSTNETETRVSPELIDSIDEEIKIRGAMYETEMLMRERKNINTPKKKRKLEKRARMLCERLAMKGGQNIEHITTTSMVTEYDRLFQNEVLRQWSLLRSTATRREMTGDRMLLAEHFRRHLENIVNENEESSQDAHNDQDVKELLLKGLYSEAYAHHIKLINGVKACTSLSSGTISSAVVSSKPRNDGAIRIVIVSDTHGMEQHLGILPDGDILLHLGDFAIDSPMKKKLKAIEKFDEWLSIQKHQTKIVLRGNHDPFKVFLPLSGANYISKPKSIAIDGRFTMSVVPFCSARNLSSSWRKLPMACDIIASHVPPHKVLDKCYNGQHAGSAPLRSRVERMIAGPPKLWLAGHIHEGRGIEQIKFGQSLTSRQTVVINCSNANEGRANKIVHGPVVLDFEDDKEVSIIQFDESSNESDSLLCASSVE